MKRVQVLSTVMAAAMSCGVVCERAQAQPEIEALLWFNGGGTSRGALNALEYTYERAVGEARFIEAMQRKSWDLVVWDLPFATFTQRETTLQLLEDHVAAGGRLLVNYNDLDSWPGLQTLLGVEKTVSFENSRSIVQTEPEHITWFGIARINRGPTFYFPDSGDELTPAPGAIVISEFEVNGSNATVLANDCRTLVNGFDWDSTQVAASSTPMIQIEYIMSCKADLDKSTGGSVLDIFDFLQFQDYFIHQHPSANMSFDKSFDIFDFLAFQQAFVNGCV